MDNENMPLATELLHELKASAKRWFIISMVELVIILCIVFGFLWYISLPTEEYSYNEQLMDDIDTTGSSNTQTITNGGE